MRPTIDKYRTQQFGCFDELKVKPLHTFVYLIKYLKHFFKDVGYNYGNVKR